MKGTIQVRVFRGEKQYVAEYLDPPVMMEAPTLDELGLVVAARARQCSTMAEREAALAMLDEMSLRPEKIPRAEQRITLGADQLYQEQKFI